MVVLCAPTPCTVHAIITHLQHCGVWGKKPPGNGATWCTKSSKWWQQQRGVASSEVGRDTVLCPKCKPNWRRGTIVVVYSQHFPSLMCLRFPYAMHMTCATCSVRCQSGLRQHEQHGAAAPSPPKDVCSLSTHHLTHILQ